VIDNFRDFNLELAKDIARFNRDPLGFVKYVYPWGKGELSEAHAPYPWQTEALTEIRDHLNNPKTRFEPKLIAVSSGHGIGKTTFMGWITNWALSTCEDCRVVITANTGTQLKTKTAPGVERWMRLALNEHWWDIQATSISVRDEKYRRTWRADYIPWSSHNAEAFAGTHNKGKRIVVLFDEASAIDGLIWETTEGALTDEKTEILWLAFGNPTQNTGRFRECFGKFKHRWSTSQIDARQVPGTNKAQIEKWIADYGEDSDFVRVRVRGEFPRAGANQFIPSDIVEAARRFKASGFENLPKILSLDVARFGDDQSVLGVRQGRQARILAKRRGLDTFQLAELFIEHLKLENPDAGIIDTVGVGAGVFDTVKHFGYGDRLFEWHPNERPRDPQTYFNVRAECWGDMRDWLKAGAEIPDDPELDADLTAPLYGFSSKMQIQIEQKEDMKERGLPSPDSGDMLAMTFYPRVAPKPRPKKEIRDYAPGQEEHGWMA
jgi:hypothetical protein